MTTAPKLAITHAVGEPTAVATFGQIRVSATLRMGKWYAAALDRVSLQVVGDGTGSDEHEAIAAALLDAKTRAKRVLRSLQIGGV